MGDKRRDIVPSFSYDDQVTTDQSAQSCPAALSSALLGLGATVDAVGTTDL